MSHSLGNKVSCAQWIRDLISTPTGFGLAACNDKITALGGIEVGVGMIRDRFHGQLTVVGVSGGNRMYVAYHTDPIGTPGKEVSPSIPYYIFQAIWFMHPRSQSTPYDTP